MPETPERRPASKSKPSQVQPTAKRGLKSIKTMIEAAKITLLKDVKKRVASKDLTNPQISQALTVAADLVDRHVAGVKVGDEITESHFFGLFKSQWVVVAVIDMALRKERIAQKEKQLALAQAENANKNVAKRPAEHEGNEIVAHAEAETAEDEPGHEFGHELDGEQAEEEGPEIDHEGGAEFEQDGEHELDPQHINLSEIHDATHDIEALKDVDINALQGELMDGIKGLPSIGDQAALLFIVSQFSPSNMDFRIEGAAHLMKNAQNALLGVEDQMLAFAGAEALRDPNSSLFAAKTPSTLDPNVIGEIPQDALASDFVSPIPQHGQQAENDLSEMFVEHGHKDGAPAPFSLIDNAGGRVAQDLSHFSHDPKKLLMAQFKLNEEITERLDTSEPEQQQPVRKQTVFDVPSAPKPTAGFFKAVMGNVEN